MTCSISIFTVPQGSPQPGYCPSGSFGSLLRFGCCAAEVELLSGLRRGSEGHPRILRPWMMAKKYPAKSAGVGRFLDCSCEISASCSETSVFALLQACGTRLERESRDAELRVSSIAPARGWERAGEIVMAMRGRMEKDFILEKVLCKPGSWTAGLTRNTLLRRTSDGRL